MKRRNPSPSAGIQSIDMFQSSGDWFTAAATAAWRSQAGWMMLVEVQWKYFAELLRHEFSRGSMKHDFLTFVPDNVVGSCESASGGWSGSYGSLRAAGPWGYWGFWRELSQWHRIGGKFCVMICWWIITFIHLSIDDYQLLLFCFFLLWRASIETETVS